MFGIIERLNWLTDTIAWAWNSLTTTVEWTIKALDYLIMIIGESHKLIGAIPNWVGGFMMITVIISVIYTILGWQAGRNE